MKDNKYEKILLISAKLLSRKGADGTSLQMIADKVGLHKSTLFHYFKNKEDLILAVIQKSVDEVDNNLEAIITDIQLEPEEKLKKAIENHLTLLVQYFDNVKVYLNELRGLSKKNQAVYLQKRKKYERDFEKIIREMNGKGYFNGMDTKIVTFGLLGMLNWLTKWYKRDGFSTISEISDVFYRMTVKNDLRANI